MAEKSGIKINAGFWSTLISEIGGLLQSSLDVVNNAIRANTQRNKDDNDLVRDWSKSNSEWSAKVLTSKDNTSVIVCGAIVAIVLVAWIIKQK